MTLEDGMRKAGILLDEYENGQIDESTEARMPDLFDMAQKQVAAIQPIVRTVTVQADGERTHAMPADFERALNVYRDGKKIDARWIGNRLETTEEVLVEYAAVPETITEDTDGGYIFEVSETAQQAMPYFVAANLVAVDMVTSPNHLLTMWQTMLAQIKGQSGRQTKVRRGRY